MWTQSTASLLPIIFWIIENQILHSIFRFSVFWHGIYLVDSIIWLWHWQCRRWLTNWSDIIAMCFSYERQIEWHCSAEVLGLFACTLLCEGYWIVCKVRALCNWQHIFVFVHQMKQELRKTTTNFIAVCKRTQKPLNSECFLHFKRWRV